MSQEFDCVECGQHIVWIVAEPGRPLLCAHCLHVPGWFNDPRLRQRFAPEGLNNLPDNETPKTGE